MVTGKIYAGDTCSTLFVQGCLNSREVDKTVKFIGKGQKVSCHANDKDRNDQRNDNRALSGYEGCGDVQDRHFH